MPILLRTGVRLLFLLTSVFSQSDNYEFFHPSGYSSSSFSQYSSPSTGAPKSSYFGNPDFSFSGQGSNGGSSIFGGFPGFESAQPVQCQPTPAPCDPKSPYRTLDGSCNKVSNPILGAANTPYGRLLPPRYADGVQAPTASVTGYNLTSARQISAVLFPDAKVPDPRWTLALMQYGQIITHDMSLAAGTTQGKAHTTRCCADNLGSPLPDDTRSNDCFPIIIPRQDPIYGPANIHCMEFVRTTNDVSQGCQHDHAPAEQISAVTHYLDSSNVFGSSQQVADSIRAFQGGLLRAELKNGREFPPSNNNKSTSCDNLSDREACYLAGDVRVNQNPQLTVFQILQFREHNRIARALQQLNPHWDDERLYQEARKVAIAEHQAVTFNEWLPIILGQEAVARNGLTFLNAKDFIRDYDEHVNPSVLNDHATAAFRFLHSNIAGFLHLIKENRKSFEYLRLSDHFNRPQVVEEGNNFDDLARGMHTQPQESSDKFFTKEITVFLFRNGQQLGQDLRAIDIQRDRDHSLASYNDYRHYCGFPKAQTFEQFGDLIDPESVAKLARLYKHPDDVEFTVGGSLEAIVPGALVGPTFQCIITEQFYRTRTGDRYFWENGEEGSLTLEQVNEIRRGSISRLICDNGDNVRMMQMRGFEQISPSNPLVPCELIPAPSLEPWREIVGHNSIPLQSSYQPKTEDPHFFQFFKK